MYAVVGSTHFSSLPDIGYSIGTPYTPEDNLSITFDSFSDGSLAGKASFLAEDQKTIEWLKAHRNINLEINYVGREIGGRVTVGLEHAGDSQIQNVKIAFYTPQNSIQIQTSARRDRGNFYYPFEAYCIEIPTNMEFLADSVTSQVVPRDSLVDTPGRISMRFDLPTTLRVRSSEFVKEDTQGPRDTCAYHEPKQSENDTSAATPAGLALFIDHPPWFKALIVLLITLLVIPTVLIFRTSFESISLDMLAGLISIATIRMFIFPNDATIHFLDIVMGLFLLIIMTVPLIKWAGLYRRE